MCHVQEQEETEAPIDDDDDDDLWTSPFFLKGTCLTSTVNPCLSRAQMYTVYDIISFIL